MKIEFVKNVVCHIAGIDKSTLDSIYKSYGNNPEIVIGNLDEISEEIKENEKMNYLFNQWSKFKEKNNDKYKSIEKEMDKHWMNLFQDNVSDIINNNKNKRIIFVGNNNHYRHLSRKIDLPTPSRFYLKVNNEKHCKDVVKGYMEDYIEDIVNGSFPLSYLDHKFIKNRRERISKYYHNWGYDLKDESEIMDFLDLTINQKKMETLDYLYYASKMPYHSGSNIHPDKNNLYAYSNPWEALYTLIPNKVLVKTGIKNGEPFIKEERENEFGKLKFRGYLYQLDKKTFMPMGRKNSTKFKSTIAAKILKKEKFLSLTSVCRKHEINCFKMKK